MQRDLANNTSDYSHKHPLPEAVSDSMLPVFEILSGEEQLSLYGGTQNSKQGFRCFDLAVCDQEDPLQSANC